MDVLVASDYRFYKTPNGGIWTDGQYPYGFWARYLSTFDTVRVLARVRHISQQLSGFVRADGQNVNFAALPDYSGPVQYALRGSVIRRTVRNLLSSAQAVILRTPGQIASVASSLMGQDRP